VDFFFLLSVSLFLYSHVGASSLGSPAIVEDHRTGFRFLRDGDVADRPFQNTPALDDGCPTCLVSRPLPPHSSPPRSESESWSFHTSDSLVPISCGDPPRGMR